MAKYDQGGGCACGLNRECECDPKEDVWTARRAVEESEERTQKIVRDALQNGQKKGEEIKKRVKDALKGVWTDQDVQDMKATPLNFMTRPWGKWQVLDEGKGFKVKRLEILVDQSISMQYHTHRSEHWTIVQGEGKVIIDGNIFKVSKGDTFFVPKLSIHKVTNTGLKETLIAIETQMGDICEENDIVRV